MSSLTVDLVAADRVVWRGEAHQVNARSVEGELGVLPGHEPLLTILGEGDVTIRGTDGTSHAATIDEGFLSVDNNHVTIVAEHVTVTQA
ncbi:ATP synthase, epsilon chain [Nostocoides japonicum T1-X7]|uniref:ATP synthase epsilon chain n=1 Tax=Nostocoides japonicum T1-X7 TaxID=1194083 RepID=A0A077LST4_9MICO|nr:F0F1 ATP synthase subunit epsilon [Tetrasphaera japonica]CCH76228.1 ATP synthase, epsilon chain [Tetrasphaera japonica T1-X7]